MRTTVRPPSGPPAKPTPPNGPGQVRRPSCAVYPWCFPARVAKILGALCKRPRATETLKNARERLEVPHRRPHVTRRCASPRRCPCPSTWTAPFRHLSGAAPRPSPGRREAQSPGGGPSRPPMAGVLAVELYRCVKVVHNACLDPRPIRASGVARGNPWCRQTPSAAHMQLRSRRGGRAPENHHDYRTLRRLECSELPETPRNPIKARTRCTVRHAPAGTR